MRCLETSGNCRATIVARRRFRYCARAALLYRTSAPWPAYSSQEQYSGMPALLTPHGALGSLARRQGVDLWRKCLLEYSLSTGGEYGALAATDCDRDFAIEVTPRMSVNAAPRRGDVRNPNEDRTRDCPVSIHAITPYVGFFSRRLNTKAASAASESGPKRTSRSVAARGRPLRGLAMRNPAQLTL